ncbi:MAG TPA: hypothetical protein VNT31_01565 [Nocardioides sp.]|nr:hypothetical protein [Nocardioides sp.]
MSDLDHTTFQRAGDATLADDPFWSAVRQRHPDVDIVLLPADGETSVPAPVVPSDVVGEVATGVLATWFVLAALIADHADAGAPTVRWAAADGGHALLLTASASGIGEEAGVGLLRDIALVLGGRGWRLAATRRAGRPLLRATDGLLDLEAEAGAGATAVRLATGVLSVAEADRDAVLDRVLEEVAS